MDCETCREALSAQLDGESEPGDDDRAHQHVAACPACRAWQRDAVRLTRAIRVRPAAATPDLTAVIVAAADDRQAMASPVEKRAHHWRRYLLGAVAFVQISVGLSELLGVSHMGMAMGSDSTHLFNESTAWNLAVGAGFAVAAVWPRLAVGLLPTLGVFLAVLTVVSVIDLVDGNADLTRVGSHVVVAVGLALLFSVHRHDVTSPGHAQRHGPDAATAGGGDMMPDRRAGSAERPGRGLRPAGRRAA